MVSDNMYSIWYIPQCTSFKADGSHFKPHIKVTIEIVSRMYISNSSDPRQKYIQMPAFRHESFVNCMKFEGFMYYIECLFWRGPSAVVILTERVDMFRLNKAASRSDWLRTGRFSVWCCVWTCGSCNAYGVIAARRWRPGIAPRVFAWRLSGANLQGTSAPSSYSTGVPAAQCKLLWFLLVTRCR